MLGSQTRQAPRSECWTSGHRAGRNAYAYGVPPSLFVRGASATSMVVAKQLWDQKFGATREIQSVRRLQFGPKRGDQRALSVSLGAHQVCIEAVRVGLVVLGVADRIYPGALAFLESSGRMGDCQ